MLTSLVVTVIGADRPGLVSLLSERGRAHGANWAESRMASLAGRFAGMVRFEVDELEAERLIAALAELESLGLRVAVERGSALAQPAGARILTLELVGNDRPGIVSDISRVLADCGVSIDELETEVVSGAMSGGNLFQARASLQVPATVTTAELRGLLEALANELMVDIALTDAPTKAGAA
jgi:glycine cleavage system regulatory protein